MNSRDRESIMKHWDSWRKYISDGGKASWPRDAFESLLDYFEAENKILRELLWLRHGCDISNLYGDDGEMQCSKCIIDFKRDSAEKIKERWESDWQKSLGKRRSFFLERIKKANEIQ